ncbi:hypothetical protein PIB30_037718, partial [Stylosanthes scabra]|nr:hypothetical protein [Stylosanthes scabra]
LHGSFTENPNNDLAPAPITTLLSNKGAPICRCKQHHSGYCSMSSYMKNLTADSTM